MTDKTDSRELALAILLEILENGGYSHAVLNQALKKYQYLDKQERAFITRVVEGTVEYALQLDYVLDTYSTVKVKRMKPVIRTLLRMSVYQILYLDRVPDSAVCNEAVKLAQKRKFSGLKGYVNGVLRTIIRRKGTLSWPDASIRYSMPSWILDMWTDTYGQEAVKVMVEAFLNPSKTAIRCNFNKASKEEIVESLREQEVVVEETLFSPAVLILSGYDYLEALLAFQKGFIQVQDLSSALVGEIADPKEGDLCLDVCGAPGGKGLHLADKLKGTGQVVIRDLTPQKTALIEANIARSGLLNVKVQVHDALLKDEAWVGKADVVLADLPCSGLGTIGRKPDVKYRMTEDKLVELMNFQREILTVVQSYVKPGGKLIYSTCTIDRKENEDNAAWFLDSFPFDVMDFNGKAGELEFMVPKASMAVPVNSGTVNPGTVNKGMLQLLPGIHPCDGFFIAAFRKKIQ